MKIEHFLQGFAIYAVISILLLAWIIKLGNSKSKKDNDKWPDGMA